MNAKDRLIQELEQPPDFLIEEVLNFLLFLRSRLLQQFRPSPPTATEAESTGERLLHWADELTSEASAEDWEHLPTEGRGAIASSKFSKPLRLTSCDPKASVLVQRLPTRPEISVRRSVTWAL